jgi:hypothetical protein
MITHQPQITIDLRDDDFRTLAELQSLVMDRANGTAVSLVIISELQHKRLRFDRYCHGTPESVVKKDILETVCGIHVAIANFDDGCPNCGDGLC